MLQALAGRDAGDPASSREPVPDYTAGLGGGVRGLRIGVPRAYFMDGLSGEVATAFEAALDTLKKLGAEVTDVTIPSIHASPAFMVILLAEAYAYHERDLREHPELFGEVLREKMLAGALFTAAEYVQAQRVRARLQAEMAEALGRVDLLATPTTITTAVPFTSAWDPNAPFAKSNMAPFNMTGLPALVMNGARVAG